MEIHDITDEVKSVSFEKPRKLNEINLPKVSAGLYLMVFKNSKDLNVRDRNYSANKNNLGKIVIPKKSTVVKYGKFENGLAKRMLGYYDHLHYEDNDPISAFKDVLVMAKFFSLDYMIGIKPAWRPSRIYEGFWNQSLENYLLANNLLFGNQNSRSEYRHLNPSIENLTNIFSDDFLFDTYSAIKNSFSSLSTID